MSAEYKLLDAEGVEVPLTPDRVNAMYFNGNIVTPNDDGTIWVDVTLPEWKYTLDVTMKDGKKYIAELDWKPDPMP
ncbi:hypothetical protein ABIE27_004693 [Paenibacillus sp. 4624]|uniref:hypothetical protein n=1 Tax=Paenibacillus sp. 4624 TaxID=3156453 RepID=UPI003D200A0C